MQDPLNETLEVARQELLLGVKLSKQGSYARRAPDAESLPHFHEADRLLKEILKGDPSNREALIMMSQLSESVLDFPAAIHYLNKAFDAGEPRTKKSLKRLALLKDNAKTWKRLKLSPASLRSLGEYLEGMGVGPNHRSLDLTREWLAANVDDDPEELIAALEDRGAYSDFQVLANVVKG